MRYCSKEKCKHKRIKCSTLCKKHSNIEFELNKIKNFLYEMTDFDIGIIEHLKVEDY